MYSVCELSSCIHIFFLTSYYKFYLMQIWYKTWHKWIIMKMSNRLKTVLMWSNFESGFRKDELREMTYQNNVKTVKMNKNYYLINNTSRSIYNFWYLLFRYSFLAQEFKTMSCAVLSIFRPDNFSFVRSCLEFAVNVCKDSMC